MKNFTFRTHLQKGSVRAERRNGQEFLVAPVVAIVEGVLNRWMVPAFAIEQSAAAWQGIPLTVNHPAMEDGEHVSIHHSDLFSKIAIGTFENAAYRPDIRGLAGELWVNVDRALHAGNEGAQIVEMLRAGDVLEVSTGYYADVDLHAGVFNGKGFRERHLALEPDHLALLPNSIGACSWQDGCGAPRLNEEERMADKTKKTKDGLQINGQKLGETLTKMIADQAGATMSEAQLVTRLAQSAGISEDKVKQVMAGKIDFAPRKWLQGFALALDTDFVDLALAADVDTAPFRSPNGINTDDHQACGCRSTEVHMKKDQKVKALIDNKKTRFSEKDRAFLMTLEEDQLDLLMPEEPTVTINAQEREPRVNAVIESGVFVAEDRGWLMTCEASAFDKIEARSKTAALATANAAKVKKEAAVNGLISNKRFGEEDREWLLSLPENKLVKMASIPAVKASTARTSEEVLETLSPEMRELFGNALTIQKAHRADLLKVLTENDDCAFTKPELEAMQTNMLEKLADAYQIEDYAGAAGGNSDEIVDNEAVPAPPKLITLARDKK